MGNVQTDLMQAGRPPAPHAENARAIAESGVDILSSGALTHSAPALDISLDIEAT